MARAKAPLVIGSVAAATLAVAGFAAPTAAAETTSGTSLIHELDAAIATAGSQVRPAVNNIVCREDCGGGCDRADLLDQVDQAIATAGRHAEPAVNNIIC